jgi:Uma2 family endonuclease
MPSALPEPAVPPPLESVPRKKWTRREIEELVSLGWFAGGWFVGERYELLDGELINKMGKGEPHAPAVLAMHEWLVHVFGFRRLRKEDPINVAAEDNELNEPEPDLVVLRNPIETLKMTRPGPEDILLVIEAADSTLRMDRFQKAALYARAGIPEYWILDIGLRRMIVHRDPGAGKYSSVVFYREDESVTPLCVPESGFRVAAAFRP